MRVRRSMDDVELWLLGPWVLISPLYITSTVPLLNAVHLVMISAEGSRPWLKPNQKELLSAMSNDQPTASWSLPSFIMELFIIPFRKLIRARILSRV